MRLGKRLQAELRARSEHICRTVDDVFECEAVYSSRHAIVIRGRPRVPPDSVREIAGARLNPEGFRVWCEESEGRCTLWVASQEERRRLPWVNVILFAATIISVLVTAALNTAGDALLRDWSLIRAGVPFTFWLLAILLLHELGHYTFSRLRGVDVSLPYFIPAPFFFILGTLGAVIKSRSPIKNRKDLLDVAAAGPLAGFVVAIPAIVIGLAKSRIIPSHGVTGYFLGDSLLFSLLSRAVVGPIPEGMDVLLHPIAFAGWVGLLVTMLNLLPVGSLDGGHIAYALIGRQQRMLGYATVAALLALSFWWPGWLIWGGIAMVMGPAHPPTVFDEIRIGRGRRIIGYLCLIVFILCFIPVPFGQ